MLGMIDWAKDLLISRGALVETEESGVLRAMLSPELAGELGASDWLSLRFGPGSDDEMDWLERLGRLMPPDPRAVGARLRHTKVVPPIDAAAVLDRELVIQNGICRLLDSYQTAARYCFFTFQYSIESDDTSLGVWTTCLNASARSLVRETELLLKAVREGAEEDPAFTIPREELAQLYPAALHAAMPEIRRLAAMSEQNASRRLARDADRVNAYYRDLLRQIDKRISRRAGDTQAEEKERSRAAATRLDCAAKLEDLARKYSIRIRVQPGDVLILPLPVREISAKVIRKKAERPAKFHWNPLLGALEAPWCENCHGPARPLFLCDDRLHFLCKSCLAPCADCGKPHCRACRPKCRCGNQSGLP